VVPLAVLEQRAILSALDYTKGDRAVAAHLLGIGRTTLYRKLK
jgi:transcriptional regulator of acetoin/glycerol metabolism